MKRIAPCSGLAFVAVLCSLAGPALGEEEPCGARILGDSDAAYKTFVEVYGLNSHYRDVSTRLQELKAQG